MATPNTFQLDFFIMTIVFFGISIFLAFYLFSKLQLIATLKKDIERLHGDMRELDHQAKLIIKSDMELKLFQEEVEDKLKKVTLLGNLISQTVQTLDRNELFSKMDEELINNLGFKQAILLAQPHGEPIWNIRFSQNNIAAFGTLIERKRTSLSTITVYSHADFENDPATKPLLEEISTKDFILAPINVGSQVYAVLIVANCILPTGITEAEKQTFLIICLYLSQRLDNIKLFEALYYAGEEVESKVKEKTFELKRSLNEIKEINKLKSEFISSVSHELRTPLTSIKGFSSLLVAEKFGTLPPEAKKRLQTIDNNVNKLVDMVNTLLDIARIESRRMEIKIVPGNVSELAREVGDLLMPQMNAKEIQFILESPKELNVYMDKNLMERVFINIINNAIKFTPENGTITVRCEPKDGAILVAIQDSGCGIKEDNLDKVFQEFYRVDNPINKQVKGTGLGLPLVKKIIETHEQKIWVESQENKGTTFYFTLKPVV